MRDEAYEIPILTALAHRGGRAGKNEVLDALEPMLADKLTELDRTEINSGEIRWRNRAQFVRLRLVERGEMVKGPRAGIWGLADRAAPASSSRRGRRRRRRAMMATTPTTPVAERDGHMAEISNPELIVFCVYRCGGVGRFIEIEDVYEEAFKVAPSRFGWRTRRIASDKAASAAMRDATRGRVLPKGLLCSPPTPTACSSRATA